MMTRNISSIMSRYRLRRLGVSPRRKRLQGEPSQLTDGVGEAHQVGGTGHVQIVRGPAGPVP